VVTHNERESIGSSEALEEFFVARANLFLFEDTLFEEVNFILDQSLSVSWNLLGVHPKDFSVGRVNSFCLPLILDVTRAKEFLCGRTSLVLNALKRGAISKRKPFNPCSYREGLELHGNWLNSGDIVITAGTTFDKE
jgi:hypothetical protein